MKKLLYISILIFFAVSLSAQTSFHDFVVQDIMGKDFALKQFKGKKVLVVNTASKCGLTPQYADLQALYEKYKDEGLVVLGFPANNFAKQEPGTNAEIREFCTDRYSVSFPMMSKISVKGDDMHPLYSWLTSKDQNGTMDSSVKWNFQKYLIDEEGNLLAFFPPKTKPLSEEIVKWLD